MFDEDDDFELVDDEKEEELEEELEEEEKEEEEEEILSFSDASDPSDSPKPRPRRKSSEPKPKPKKKAISTAPPPLVDFTRITRKRRVFTPELLSPTPATSTPRCAFCHRLESQVEGGFVSSHPFVGKDGPLSVHKMCALNSQEVARSASAYYNLQKAVNRGKKIRCKKCGTFGASVMCCVNGCLKWWWLWCVRCSRYHIPCAVEEGLLSPDATHFPFIDQNQAFFCHDHTPLKDDVLLKAIVPSHSPLYP